MSRKLSRNLREILVHQHPERSGFVRASLRGRPALWSDGATTEEAVGTLVLRFPRMFRVEVHKRVNLTGFVR